MVRNKEEKTSFGIVDTEIVSFFDLLAKFDYQDSKNSELSNKNNRKEISAVRASEKTCSVKLKG